MTLRKILPYLSAVFVLTLIPATNAFSERHTNYNTCYAPNGIYYDTAPCSHDYDYGNGYMGDGHHDMYRDRSSDISRGDAGVHGDRGALGFSGDHGSEWSHSPEVGRR